MVHYKIKWLIESIRNSNIYNITHNAIEHKKIIQISLLLEKDIYVLYLELEKPEYYYGTFHNTIIYNSNEQILLNDVLYNYMSNYGTLPPHKHIGKLYSISPINKDKIKFEKKSFIKRFKNFIKKYICCM